MSTQEQWMDQEVPPVKLTPEPPAPLAPEKKPWPVWVIPAALVGLCFLPLVVVGIVIYFFFKPAVA